LWQLRVPLATPLSMARSTASCRWHHHLPYLRRCQLEASNSHPKKPLKLLLQTLPWFAWNGDFFASNLLRIWNLRRKNC
jgi:hypothetical protein